MMSNTNNAHCKYVQIYQIVLNDLSHHKFDIKKCQLNIALEFENKKTRNMKTFMIEQCLMLITIILNKKNEIIS